MKTSDWVLIDTNILIYAQDVKSDHYLLAQKIHQQVIEGKLSGCLAIQNIAEFMSVITNPKRVPKPLSIKQAKKEVTKYLSSGVFKIIYQQATTGQILESLLQNLKPNNPQQIFDLQLAATMLSNGVDKIITLNKKDFSAISDIQVIPPIKSNL